MIIQVEKISPTPITVDDQPAGNGKDQIITITSRRQIATFTFSEGNCTIAGNYTKTFPVIETKRFHFVDPASLTQWLVTTKKVEETFTIHVECIAQHPQVSMLVNLPAPTISKEFVAIFKHVKELSSESRLFVVYSRITGEMGCFPGKDDKIKSLTFEGRDIPPFRLKEKTGHLQLAEMLHMPAGSYFGFTAFTTGIKPDDDNCLRSEANPCIDHMSRSAPKKVAELVAKAFNQAVNITNAVIF